MTHKLPRTGGCACGSVRYECSANPLFMFFCRCTGCRRATGNAFAMNVWFPANTVTIRSGILKEFVIQANSGQPARHEFCPDCGSPIGMQADAFPEIRGIRAGSFDDPSGLTPSANVWLTSKLPWDVPDSTIPSYERNVTPEDLQKMLE